MAEQYRIIVQAFDSDKMIQREDTVDYRRQDLMKLVNALDDSHGLTDCAMLSSAIWHVLDGT